MWWLIDSIKKINLGSRTDFKRQIIKGKLRHKGDELRGFNTHLIGVPEERLEEKIRNIWRKMAEKFPELKKNVSISDLK